MIDLPALLGKAANLGASDLHLKVGTPPFVRVMGELVPLAEAARLAKTDTLELIGQLLNQRQREVLARQSEVDISLGVEGLGRYRVAIYQQRGTIALSLRLIPTAVPTIDDLNLPPILKALADASRGLILVTGITGSGKSTTLASMIRNINETRQCHILTIEDPVEFLFRDEKSMVSQREVGTDTRSFALALRAAMRQDPDVIMVGEMRDVETIQIALQGAQTGHLIMSTLHTTDAVSTVNRVISMFSAEQQLDVRLQLAAALHSVVSLRLIKSSLSDKRFPAVEILRNTQQVQAMISDSGRLKEVKDAIEKGQSQYGMQTFDQSILRLYANNLISREDALKAASSPEDLDLRIKGIVPSAESV